MSGDPKDALTRAFELATSFRAQEQEMVPGPARPLAELREAFDVGLPDGPRAGSEIIETMAAAAEGGLFGTVSPRHFCWVMGSSHPVGVAADWLAASWGQNAGIYETSPASAVVEEVAAKWLLDLMDLPPEASVGFTTGATMASFICLSAARTEVLRKVGWDLEEEGLIGAPSVCVLLGTEAHATIHAGLRYLGFGEKQKTYIKVDDQGRMCADDLAAKLEACQGPKIIIAQAGHINSGAFDPMPEIVKLAQKHDAWCHVDGAFGLWVRSVPSLAHLGKGLEGADSWSVDGHKWLQVPYDSGFAIVKNEPAHRRAMDIQASYIAAGADAGRSPSSYGPELSRRARGFAVWATIQALGRSGIEEMVTRHCDCARQLRDALELVDGIEVMNDVVLNQLAIRFGNDEDAARKDQLTDQVIEAIVQESEFGVRGARWKDQNIMRISVISQHTNASHMDGLANSIIRAWRTVSTKQN